MAVLSASIDHFLYFRYRDGSREGNFVFHKSNSFPYGALGPVSFMWNPKVEAVKKKKKGKTEEKPRQLWIWVHPAAIQDVLEELQLHASQEDCPGS